VILVIDPNYNYKDPYNGLTKDSRIIKASKAGNVELVKSILLDESLHINDYLYHALINAVSYNHFDIVKLILEDGRFFEGGQSLPLADSIYDKADSRIISILMQYYKDDINKANTLVALAVRSNHNEILNILLNAGIKGTKSALHNAMWYQNKEAIEALLRNGNMNEKDITKVSDYFYYNKREGYNLFKKIMNKIG